MPGVEEAQKKFEVAEKLFYANVSGNSKLAKKKTKPKRKEIWKAGNSMKPEEVLQVMKTIGIKIDIRTLQRYAREGVGPIPERRSLVGEGRISKYPDQAPYEYAASWKIKKDTGLSFEAIKAIREMAIDMERKNTFPVIDDENGKSLILNSIAGKKISVPFKHESRIKGAEYFYFLAGQWLYLKMLFSLGYVKDDFMIKINKKQGKLEIHWYL